MISQGDPPWSPLAQKTGGRHNDGPPFVCFGVDRRSPGVPRRYTRLRGGSDSARGCSACSVRFRHSAPGGPVTVRGAAALDRSPRGTGAAAAGAPAEGLRAGAADRPESPRCGGRRWWRGRAGGVYYAPRACGFHAGGRRGHPAQAHASGDGDADASSSVGHSAAGSRGEESRCSRPCRASQRGHAGFARRCGTRSGRRSRWRDGRRDRAREGSWLRPRDRDRCG